MEEGKGRRRGEEREKGKDKKGEGDEVGRVRVMTDKGDGGENGARKKRRVRKRMGGSRMGRRAGRGEAVEGVEWEEEQGGKRLWRE